jgi:ribosomal protein S6
MFYFFNLLSIYQLIVTNTSAILISICIITYLYNEIFTILYKDEKIIYQLAFLLNLFLVGEEENTQFEKEIFKIKSLHDATCKNKLDGRKCLICDQSEITISQNSMEEDKINLMQSMFRYVEENVIDSLSEEEFDFFNFMNLIFNYSLTQKDSSIPHFKFIYKAKNLIEKNKENKNNYYYNLVLYYNKINCQSEVNLKKFKIVKNYDSSLLGLKKSIDIVKEIVMTIESKVKKDLYPQTNELNKQKKFIMKNLEEIHLLKNVTNDTFSFVMCKYIFEKTFNIDANTESKILGDSDDFDSRQDFVEYRFCKDSIMIVKYKVHEDSLFITRATKNFVPYQGKYFEEVFPKRFRILGKQKFIHEIDKNNEGFEFEFLLDDQHDFVKTVKFDCKIFRAPDLQELFIFINFEISKEDLIVFETPKVFDIITSSLNHEMNKSFLSAISNHLEKILFINPRLIDFLLGAKLPKKTILLTDMFRKMNLAKNGEEGRNRDITGTDFLLSYKSYYSNFFSEIEKSQQSLEDEEVNRRINQVKHMVNANISLNIRLNLKYMINKSEDCDYCVFSFKNFTTKKMNIGGELNAEERVLLDAILGDGNKKGSEDHSEDSEKAQEHFENEFKSGQTANSSGASVNGTQKANILADITINGKKSSLGTSENRMAKFTITTLAINICLGIYCIIFLVIGFTSNKKMQELDSLKTYFNVFERFFYQTALSKFYNVGVY